jgi:hypothetical protein
MLPAMAKKLIYGGSDEWRVMSSDAGSVFAALPPSSRLRRDPAVAGQAGRQAGIGSGAFRSIPVVSGTFEKNYENRSQKPEFRRFGHGTNVFSVQFQVFSGGQSRLTSAATVNGVLADGHPPTSNFGATGQAARAINDQRYTNKNQSFRTGARPQGPLVQGGRPPSRTGDQRQSYLTAKSEPDWQSRNTRKKLTIEISKKANDFEKIKPN